MLDNRVSLHKIAWRHLKRDIHASEIAQHQVPDGLVVVNFILLKKLFMQTQGHVVGRSSWKASVDIGGPTWCEQRRKILLGRGGEAVALCFLTES